MSASEFKKLETVTEEFKFESEEKGRGAQEGQMGCGASRRHGIIELG
jgi:hypothetical protein